MTITWYGHFCFKIASTGGQLTIITDPFDKKIGLNPPRGNADIITVSRDQLSHNNTKTISGEPFIIDGPGEYGVKGINIKGVGSFHDDKEKETNTIYLIEVDKMKVCHLGSLGQKQLTDKQLETIGQVDILMIPVGDKETLNANQAARMIERIEPGLIIPMYYKLKGVKIEVDGLAKFLKEMGVEDKKPVNKLTLKKKDLAVGRTEVVVMKP